MTASDATDQQAADARALLDLIGSKSSLVADLDTPSQTTEAGDGTAAEPEPKRKTRKKPAPDEAVLPTEPEPKPKPKRKTRKKPAPDEAILPPEPVPEPAQVPAAAEPAPAATATPILSEDALALFLAETMGVASTAEDSKPAELLDEPPEQLPQVAEEEARSTAASNESVQPAKAADEIVPLADEVMAAGTAAAAEKTAEPEPEPAIMEDRTNTPLPSEEASAPAQTTAALETVPAPAPAKAPDPALEPQDLPSPQPPEPKLHHEPEFPPISAEPLPAADLEPVSAVKKYKRWIYAGAASLVVAGAGGIGYWGWSQKAVIDEQASVIARYQQETLIRLADEARKKAAEEAAAVAAAAEPEPEPAPEPESPPAPAEAAAPASRAVEIAKASQSQPGTEMKPPPAKPKARPSENAVPAVPTPFMREATYHAPRTGSAPVEKLAPVEVRSEPVAMVAANSSPNPSPSYKPATQASEPSLSISADMSLRARYMTATPEELVAYASQCSGINPCAMVMMAAADPYNEAAIQAAMAKAQAYNRAQTGNRKAAANLSQQGQAEQQRGNHQRAVELFRQALASDPSHAGTMSLLAQSLLSRGELEESSKVLASALAIDPSRTSTWIEVADLFALKGNNEIAHNAMVLAYRLWPDKVRARRYFQTSAQNDERPELRPLYQSALRSIQKISLRGS